MQNISLPFELFIREGLLQRRQQLEKVSSYHVGLMSGEDSINLWLLDINIYHPKIR